MTLTIPQFQECDSPILREPSSPDQSSYFAKYYSLIYELLVLCNDLSRHHQQMTQDLQGRYIERISDLVHAQDNKAWRATALTIVRTVCVIAPFASGNIDLKPLGEAAGYLVKAFEPVLNKESHITEIDADSKLYLSEYQTESNESAKPLQQAIEALLRDLLSGFSRNS